MKMGLPRGTGGMGDGIPQGDVSLTN